MAEIVINDSEYAKGKVSFSRIKQLSEDYKVRVTVNGVLSVLRYYEEITSIETRRYKLTGIDVYQEDYGSDDHTINYSFTAKELEVKGIDDKNRSLFTEDEIEELENIIYPGEDINKGETKKEDTEKEGDTDGREGE